MKDEKVLEVMIELINDAHSDYDYCKHMDHKEDKYKENVKNSLEKLSDMLGVTKSMVDGQIYKITSEEQYIKLYSQIRTLKNQQNETK